MSSDLRIRRVIVEDFKGLREVDITRHGRGLIMISGKNAAGKTSILDSLMAALCGGRAAPERPIREGCSSALVSLTLADSLGDRYDVSAAWQDKDGKTTRYLNVLEIVGDNVSKSKVGSPQSVLDTWVGSLSFDPLAFSKETNSKRRLAMLIDAAGISEEWGVWNGRIAALEDTRKSANRELSNLDIVCRNTRDPSPGVMLSRVDAKAIEAELNSVKKIEHHRGQLTNDINNKLARVLEFENTINRYKAEIARLDGECAAERDSCNKLKDELSAFGDPIDTNEIIAKFSAVEEANRKYDQQQAAIEISNKLRVAGDIAHDAYVAVKEARNSQIGLLSTSDLVAGENGIHGLSITQDGEITINNIPLDQISGSERLALSTVICMRSNRRLRVMCIDEADGLDADNMAQLAQLAEREQYDVWVTTVWSHPIDGAEYVCVENGTIA